MATVKYDASRGKWKLERGGRSKRKRTWHATRQEAMALKREYQLAEEVARIAPPPEAATPRPETSIEEAVERYLSTITVRKSEWSQYYEPMILSDLKAFF